MQEPHAENAKRYIRKIGSATFTVSILSSTYGTRGAKCEVSEKSVVVRLDEELNGVRELYNERFRKDDRVTLHIHPKNDKLVLMTFAEGRQLAFLLQSTYETRLLEWCVDYFQQQ